MNILNVDFFIRVETKENFITVLQKLNKVAESITWLGSPKIAGAPNKLDDYDHVALWNSYKKDTMIIFKRSDRTLTLGGNPEEWNLGDSFKEYFLEKFMHDEF